MAKNKYSYRKTSGSKKPIIIVSAIAVAAAGITIGVIANNAAQENKIAAAKYNLNQFYPETYNSSEEIAPDTDYDSDGLTNAEELSLATNGAIPDSDGDGILDGMERMFSTEPNNRDTDHDGVADGMEVLAGLDPLKDMTDGKTRDAERKFTVVNSFEEGRVKITGDAYVYGSTARKLALNTVSANAGAITLPYELYCENPFDSAEITFNYNESYIKASEISEESLCIYKFDPYTKKYTALDSVTDPESASVTAKIESNGVYVLGAEGVIQSAVFSEDSNVNIHLLIDNSGSMYPKSVLSSSEENDVNFKRLTFARNFVSKLSDNAKTAISAFTYEFKPMCDFEAAKEKVMSAIEGIRTLGAGFDGTSVERALIHGLDTFTPEMKADRNTIILLTDGISTNNAGYSLDEIAAKAHAKNVTIMTISLGNEYDREFLSTIAEITGGKYFQISEANALESLYSTILASMDDDIVDEDMDGTADSYSLFDTGFDPTENGFSFENFKSKTADTLDFGMVMMARDWFKNAVPNSVTTDDESTSYTFEGTTIDRTAPIRKVVLNSMQSDYLNPETYLDFLSPPGTLKLTKEAEKEAVEWGWYTKTMPYTDENAKWTEVQYLAINHTIGKIRAKYSEDDFQFIRAIHYYESFRDKDKGFTLTDDGDLNRAKEILSTGTPLIMKMSWEENGKFLNRYVLLTALRRDLDSPNLIKGKIYDVNHNPVSTVEFNRSPRIIGKQKSGYTYSASWNEKTVSVSFCNPTAK